MLTSLTQIHVKSDLDILRLHELAIQLAGWAGLPPTEQICFATNISNSSFTSHGEEVIFSIYEQKDGRSFLRAFLKNQCYVIERELSSSVRIHDMPVFNPDDTIEKNKWEKYRDMQQFTFALSHDLKNSLTKLKLALSLAEEEELAPPLDSYMQIIHRSADRLEGMMLSLNKIIEVGDASPDVVTSLSIIEVFTDVKEEFNDGIHRINLSLDIDFTEADSLNYIEVFLKSIFSNLLSNAIKYSSPDRQPFLKVKATKQDGYIVLSFSDNGQGIDLDKFGDKLFLPFTRFSSKVDGSGVGLYLIKNMVERNGGRIEVTSVPGQGTGFRVFLREYKLPS